MGGRDVRVLAGGLVSRTNAGKPCPHISRDGKSCPSLLPCATHPPRDRNAPWSEGRNSTEQGRFARALRHRSHGICERCRVKPAQVAHHVRPGYDPSCGLDLCHDCHRAVDAHAR
jgi:hypothetical protein